MDNIADIAQSIQKKADASIISNLSFFELGNEGNNKQKAVTELILINSFQTVANALYQNELVPIAENAIAYFNRADMNVDSSYRDSSLLINHFLNRRHVELENRNNFENYELPYMQLQHHMIQNLQKNMLIPLIDTAAYKKTALGRNQSLIISDYLDMYSITHTVFYTTYLNRFSLGDLVKSEASLTNIVMKLLQLSIFAYKDHHFDLLGEVLICSYNIWELLDQTEKALITTLLQRTETEFLDGVSYNLKMKKVAFLDVYHPLLIMSLLGRMYAHAR